MPLQPGLHLGSYRIVAQLGAGGMGEVYRAHDDRLGRDVAIKVLPPAFAVDPERLRRFELEARSAGGLNHPNLLSVLDVGNHDGSPYLVMELLEGETLRNKLNGHPLPIRKAVEIAQALAQGLAAVHEKGIVHRDLKPENVFLTRDGRVKVLDFGLAKFHVPAAGLVTESQDTQTMDARRPELTGAGMMLGTVGYMSPEQIRGEALDGRSDLFALGTLLWEMLTGKRPFSAPSALETLNAILREEPQSLDPGLNLPLALERLLHRCLAKEPSGRFHSASDLAFALESCLQSSESRERPGMNPARRRRLWLAASMLLGACALAGAGYLLRPAPPVPALTQLTFKPGAIYGARFGPDGREVFYDLRPPAQPATLTALHLDGLEESPLGLPSALLLAVSPQGQIGVQTDGICDQWIWSWSHGTLAVSDNRNRSPVPLSTDVLMADVNAAGDIAAVRYVDGRFLLEFPLGRTRLDQPMTLFNPRFSPDGRYLAFLNYVSGGWVCAIQVLETATGRIRTLTEEAGYSGLAWKGREVWFSRNSRRHSTQLGAVTLGGSARIAQELPGKVSLLDADRDGRLLLAVRRNRIPVRVWNPALQPRDFSVEGQGSVWWASPDGKRVIICDLETSRGATHPVYDCPVDGGFPASIGWVTPEFNVNADGTMLVAVDYGPPPALVLTPIGLQGGSRRIPCPTLESILFPAWAQDGKRLVLIANEKGHKPRLWGLDLDDGAGPVPLSAEGITAIYQNLLCSPDGRYAIAETRGAPVLCDLRHPERDPTLIAGLLRGEYVGGWNQDSRHVYAFRQGSPLPQQLWLVDITSGRRTLVRNLDSPADAGQQLELSWVTPDGKTVASSVYHQSAELYMLEGLK